MCSTYVRFAKHLQGSRETKMRWDVVMGSIVCCLCSHACASCEFHAASCRIVTFICALWRDWCKHDNWVQFIDNITFPGHIEQSKRKHGECCQRHSKRPRATWDPVSLGLMFWQRHDITCRGSYRWKWRVSTLTGKDESRFLPCVQRSAGHRRVSCCGFNSIDHALESTWTASYAGILSRIYGI